MAQRAFAEALAAFRETAFTVACCRSADTPLVFVSPAFCGLTGYELSECLGRNCRFLQGRGSSRRSVSELRHALTEERSVCVCLLNYTRSQGRFWNQCLLLPVRQADGQARFYLGLSHSRPDSPGRGRHDGQSSHAAWRECCPQLREAQQQLAAQICSALQALLAGSEACWVDAPLGPPQYSLPASLLAPLSRLRHPFVLTDPRQPDGPVVHASPLFLRLCGYPREFVIGRNCRFMQGPSTDTQEVQRVRRALDDPQPQPFTVQLLNYRGNNKPFWNLLHICPIRDHEGRLAHFVGLQLDVTETSAKVAAARPVHLREAPISSAQPAAGTDTTAGLDQGVQHPRVALEALEASTGQQDSGMHIPPVRQVPEHEKRAQQSVVGAVRVACRALGATGGLRRPVHYQRRASMDVPLRRISTEWEDLLLRRSSEGPSFRAQRHSRMAAEMPCSRLQPASNRHSDTPAGVVSTPHGKQAD